MPGAEKDPFAGVANRDNLSREEQERILKLANKKRETIEIEDTGVTTIVIDALSVLVGGAVGYILGLEWLEFLIGMLI